MNITFMCLCVIACVFTFAQGCRKRQPREFRVTGKTSHFHPLVFIPFLFVFLLDTWKLDMES